MRQIVIAFVAACALVGCSPVVEPPPPPPPTVEETPTGPVFTEKEQAYVDAVHAFLDVWTQIMRDPPGQDWEAIREVTWPPLEDEVLMQFLDWEEGGLHLEGAPQFTADEVRWSSTDYRGEWYYVYGCFDITESVPIDRQGNQLASVGEDLIYGRFEVLKTPEGRFYVADDADLEDEKC